LKISKTNNKPSLTKSKKKFTLAGVKIQGGSQKLLLTTKEAIVSSSIFSGPPCIKTFTNFLLIIQYIT